MAVFSLGFGLGSLLSQLCCFFCCPPCPSHIIGRVAFDPPYPSTYSMDTDANGATNLNLIKRVNRQKPKQKLDAVEVFKTRSIRGNQLGCMFIRCAETSQYTVLYSHGNASDLGYMCHFYIELGSTINCNVLSYDYSGYGVSSGKPSEKNLLHSPLMSALRVACPNTCWTYCFDIFHCCDAFPSIDKVSKVASPVLIIHGLEDDVVDFSHGQAMYERCQHAVEPLWVEGGGHNNITVFPQYMKRLKQFISSELSTPQHGDAFEHNQDIPPPNIPHTPHWTDGWMDR